jgi:hypothetical protein
MKSKYKISEDRILQISNNISENDGEYTKKELIEVVKYFRDEFDNSTIKINKIRDFIVTKELEIVVGINTV